MLHCCSQPDVPWVPCYPSTDPNPPLAHTRWKACCLPALLQTKPAARTHTSTHTDSVPDTGHPNPCRMCSPLPIIHALKKEHCWQPNLPQRPPTPSLTRICQSASTVQPCCTAGLLKVPHPLHPVKPGCVCLEAPRPQGQSQPGPTQTKPIVPHTPQPQHTRCCPPACHLLSKPSGATPAVCVCVIGAAPRCVPVAAECTDGMRLYSCLAAPLLPTCLLQPATQAGLLCSLHTLLNIHGSRAENNPASAH